MKRLSHVQSGVQATKYFERVDKHENREREFLLLLWPDAGTKASSPGAT